MSTGDTRMTSGINYRQWLVGQVATNPAIFEDSKDRSSIVIKGSKEAVAKRIVEIVNETIREMDKR